MPEKSCLICEKTIVLHEDAPYGAVVWRSLGDYGSKVYDSMTNDVFLEALICDDCLVEKNDFIEEVVVRRTTEVVERRTPGFC